jgi:hypothetical protein
MALGCTLIDGIGKANRQEWRLSWLRVIMSRMSVDAQVILQSPSPAIIFEIFQIQKWSAVERRKLL